MSFLPEDTLLYLDDLIPCRALQIKQISSLLLGPSLSCLVIHGVKATGKSSTINAILEAIEAPSTIVRSQECITTRHLLERSIASVKNAYIAKGMGEIEVGSDARCESISAFVVELQRMLEGRERFFLVFDGVDRQREAAPTLMPAIARLGEIVSNLTTVVITTSPQPHLFHHSSLPQVYFPPYTRAESLSIISKHPLPISDSPSTSSAEDAETPKAANHEDSAWLWTRFTAAVWDSLGQSVARDLVSFREVCRRLWGPFIQPVIDGHYGTREFPKLLVKNRGFFQTENALADSIVPMVPVLTNTRTQKPKAISHNLPFYPAYLIVSAYLASHNPPRHDITIFSKSSLSKRRKRGGGTALTSHRTSKHRKVSRKLLGPQPFPLERLFAIFHAILPHDMKGGGESVMSSIATLTSLRLVVRAGLGGDVLEGGGKWRCNVGWEFVHSVARGVKFDLESFLIE